MKGILGRKLEMTQIFSEHGKLIPVTVIEVEPNTVLQVKTPETDGYVAVKLGTIDKRVNLVNKPEMGNFKKANTQPKRFVKEIRDMNGYETGAVINAADVFNAGEFVDVTGISKGKGFAGSIKRHNYSRGPMGHGSGYHRGIGSMGAIINRIFKSKKMPGHMGHEQVTIQNLEVIKIDSERNLVLVKGSVPGPRKGFVILKQNVKGIASQEAVKLLVRNAAPAPAAVVETNKIADQPTENVEPTQVVEETPVVAETPAAVESETTSVEAPSEVEPTSEAAADSTENQE